MKRLALLATATLLGALAVEARTPTNWRTIISQSDHQHLTEWRSSWTVALAQARAAGFGAAIDREGVLLMPDAALDRPDLPDGLYRCRTIRLGNRLGQDGVADRQAFVATPIGSCRVSGGTLLRLDGPQRPGGHLYPYDGARIVFLGGLAVGDEPSDTRYRHDAQRALAGLIERIGPAHWRLVLPRPAWESRIQVLDLVPAEAGA